MKKSTLAMAIAAALAGFGTVAQADTTLYGSARVSVDYDELNSDYVRLPNGDLERISTGSRLAGLGCRGGLGRRRPIRSLASVSAAHRC